jgi:hypothetical protein
MRTPAPGGSPVAFDGMCCNLAQMSLRQSQGWGQLGCVGGGG